MDKTQYLRLGRASEIPDFKNRLAYRLFETVPGLLAWGFLIGLFVLAFFVPAGVAIFVIAFDFYWLVKIVYLSFHLRSSYRRMRANLKIDWWQKLKLDYAERWPNFWHLVILPMYNEPSEVVMATLGALKRANYDPQKMIVVLAIEERAGEPARRVAAEAEQHFGSQFFKFLVTVHPADIPGELAGKGANETWAARGVKKELIDPLGLDYAKIIVSVFDIDTVVGPDYFALLTHRYLEHPNPTRVSFQPIPFYTNNIWEAPALARVLSFSTTFWQMMQQERPERQATFSSHAMNFETLVEIGFWQTNVVSEDSRIFWQCYLYYDGDYEVESLFYPVSMDANVAPSFWRTMANQYKQHRRWAWGSENTPYVLFGFLKNRSIGALTKIRRIFEITEGYHSWATNSLIIFLMGWLPVFVGGTAFNVTLLSYNLPRITRILMTLALVGVVSSVVLSINLLPPRPPGYGRHRYILMVLQWLLLPATMIIFGSIPALDAQTRLMLGKYMGFWSTPKHRRGVLHSAD